MGLLKNLLGEPLEAMEQAAAALTRNGFGDLHTYSPKVFLPLTQLCRDSCHYCVFAHPPRRGQRAYLPIEEVVRIAAAGRDLGCTEALFTLGDKPELRFRAAREELAATGYESTIDYLEAAAGAVLDRAGLLPHINAGVMSRSDMARLRRVSASMGLMVETTVARLSERGGPHFGSPDKDPAVRLACIEAAGELAIPFTSGILIGIGETREERVEALKALAAIQARHGHLQEVIVQNFRAKPGTRMADAPEPSAEEMRWTVAAARLIFGANMPIQAPPNLSADDLPALIRAGASDWGGVSPLTPDHVNPEAPWPERDRLRAETAAAGKLLVERLTIYPRYVRDETRWLDPAVAPHVRRLSDADGLARIDRWRAGDITPFPAFGPRSDHRASDATRRSVDRALDGETLEQHELAALFTSRGADLDLIVGAADLLRRQRCGDAVTFVVNRNINYTNVCQYACTFCAFSKGRGRTSLRGPAYDLDLAEVARRAREAWDRGATEVCMQGGIHPAYTGRTYLDLLETVKTAVPDLHVHAFSPLEVNHGAETLGLSVPAFLADLKAAGLGSLPGTAAEVLDDRVRAILCPDKLDTARWLSTIEAAHEVGLRTTATIMFGHIDRPEHWANHLLAIRDLQRRTSGFTEFVPLPFVHAEAPLSLRGQARHGPTPREVILMHALARLALDPVIPNIQASWVKAGPQGVAALLAAGVNDLGGTLMNESISAAAGAAHGQEFGPLAMEELICGVGRMPQQRSTLYGPVATEHQARARTAAPLTPIRLSAPVKRAPSTRAFA